MIIFVFAPYGEFYFFNFDFVYLNKYCMNFNTAKCITKYKALATTYITVARQMFVEGV